MMAPTATFIQKMPFGVNVRLKSSRVLQIGRDHHLIPGCMLVLEIIKAVSPRNQHAMKPKTKTMACSGPNFMPAILPLTKEKARHQRRRI
jgi:hypothetical protein